MLGTSLVLCPVNCQRARARLLYREDIEDLQTLLIMVGVQTPFRKRAFLLHLNFLLCRSSAYCRSQAERNSPDFSPRMCGFYIKSNP